MSPVGADLGCGRSCLRAREECRRNYRDVPAAWPDGGRDGSAYRGRRRGADDLRHVQGGRSRHGRYRSASVAQIGRQIRRLGGEILISVEEALTRLLALIETLPPEQIALSDGLGRVLAEDLAARRTQPPFAVSAMDGYAVRSEDLAQVPVELRIVAE